MSENDSEPVTCCIFTWEFLMGRSTPAPAHDLAVDILMAAKALCLRRLSGAVLAGRHYIGASVSNEMVAVSVLDHPERPDDVRLSDDGEEAATGIGAFAGLAMLRMLGLHGIRDRSLEAFGHGLQDELSRVMQREADPLEDADEEDVP